MKTKWWIVLFVSIIIYVITFVISSDYIILDGRHNDIGENLLVITYYVLLLPIFSILPCVIFVLIGRMLSPEPKKEENICMVGGMVNRIKSSGTTNTIPLWALHDLARSKYWSFISCHLKEAVDYMAQHPDKFYIPKNINDKPKWEDTAYREDLYINGNLFPVYVQNNTFMVDLHNCVEYIKSQIK